MRHHNPPPVALVPSLWFGVLVMGAWLALTGLPLFAALDRKVRTGTPFTVGTWLLVGVYVVVFGWPFLSLPAFVRRRPRYILSVEGIRLGPEGELVPWAEIVAVRPWSNGRVRLILRDPAFIHARSMTEPRRRNPWRTRMDAAFIALTGWRPEHADLSLDAALLGYRQAKLIALIERYRAAGRGAVPFRRQAECGVSGVRR